MLVPAICYREEIVRCLQQYFYTDEMFYFVGGPSNWVPSIDDGTRDYLYSKEMREYAIVSDDDNKELLGYFSYRIDFDVSLVYNFGLISFKKTKYTLGHDLYTELENLYNQYHTIEFKMIGNNPVERSYDNFCKKHNGTKSIFKDRCRGFDGKIHDTIVYEIINEENPLK